MKSARLAFTLFTADGQKIATSAWPEVFAAFLPILGTGATIRATSNPKRILWTHDANAAPDDTWVTLSLACQRRLQEASA